MNLTNQIAIRDLFILPHDSGSNGRGKKTTNFATQRAMRWRPMARVYVRVVNLAPHKSMQITTRSRYVLGLSARELATMHKVM